MPPALIRNLATAYIRTAGRLLTVALLEEMFAANSADKSLQYLQKVFQAYQASLPTGEPLILTILLLRSFLSCSRSA